MQIKMSSKFIPHRGLNQQKVGKVKRTQNKPDTWVEFWSNEPKEIPAEQRAEMKRIEKAEREAAEREAAIKKAKREKILSIPLEKLTWKDMYEFPFRCMSHLDWVHDNEGNFMFQFERGVAKESIDKLIKYLNKEPAASLIIPEKVYHKNGEIYVQPKDSDKEFHVITIRGWGNLTGIGSFNFPGEVGAKIQDTFADWLVEQIQGKENNEI